jgi:5-methylcytosine-specific restriction endonuclease McrA
MQFVSEVTDEDIKRERRIARELRKSIWWKRKCSDGRCYYCNTKIHPKELTMDHIVPLIRGGRSTKSNIVTACKVCNTRKKYMLLIEWEDYLTKLSLDY